jgi:hypothetical protein
VKPPPKLPPVWLVRGLNLLRNALLKVHKKLFPGNVVLYEQFQIFWLLPSLYVAAKLDVAGVLKNGPKTVEVIAQHTGSDPGALYRIFRALSSQGIFKELKDGRFGLNSISRGLLDEPGSLRYTILHHLGPVNWNLMSNLMVAVQTGKDPFADLYGMPIYNYLQQHPEEYAVFDRSMSNLSDLGLEPVLSSYDFGKYPVIVDIGGGEGFLLANILARYDAVSGILFDLPEAVIKASSLLNSLNVEQRCIVFTGDFFSAIIPEGELYILKNIIHNWNDDDCVRMLTNIRRSMKPGAKILIIDMLVQTINTPALAPLLDIQMLACMHGGKERSKAEFEKLLDQSGFRVNRFIPTIAPISLIEAQPLNSPHHV